MKRDHYILGIGMSAGGLQSVAEFFGILNSGLPLSIVIAAHLQGNFQVKLMDILADKSDLNVEELVDDSEMVEGTIYVAAAGMELLVDGKLLKVRGQSEDKRVIDTLFSSMAASVGISSIAMILSGTGNDGVQGLQAISESGGLVLVPDKILPPVRMAAWLNKYLASAERATTGGSTPPAA